jgi:uncharacterized membrane protein (UPF0127 family)
MKDSTKKYCLVFLALFFIACGRGEKTVPVEVKSAQSGEVLGIFQAEIADETNERAMGLMFREELGKNEGMLFIWPENTTGSFWMKNTLISLDIIFIDGEHKIINIVREAVPQTTTPRKPEGPYRFVLEIPGGRTAQLGIQAGDRVNFKI